MTYPKMVWEQNTITLWKALLHGRTEHNMQNDINTSGKGDQGHNTSRDNVWNNLGQLR